MVQSHDDALKMKFQKAADNNERHSESRPNTDIYIYMNISKERHCMHCPFDVKVLPSLPGCHQHQCIGYITFVNWGSIWDEEM